MKSKPKETAALLLCIGVVLWIPPVALIFGKPSWLFEIPLPVFYVFGTWLGLVVGAVAVSRLLPQIED